MGIIPHLKIYIICLKGDGDMIVTSKRCFLNVLTQICTLDVLLNANYYMADIKSPSGSVNLQDSLSYVNGELVVTSETVQSVNAIGSYNIKYCPNTFLSPDCYFTSLLTGDAKGGSDNIDWFINHLNKTDTMLQTYKWLFMDEPKGNGQQILIYNSEAAVANTVYLVCEYLSMNFGCDIVFIDPVYRSNVKGKRQYTGDKAYGQQNIMRLRDYALYKAFHDHVTEAGYYEGSGNLITYLSSFDTTGLLHLYNVVFPNEPLNPGYYTDEQLREIIIGMAMRHIPRRHVENLIINDADYEDLIGQYSDDDGIY